MIAVYQQIVWKNTNVNTKKMPAQNVQAPAAIPPNSTYVYVKITDEEDFTGVPGLCDALMCHETFPEKRINTKPWKLAVIEHLAKETDLSKLEDDEYDRIRDALNMETALIKRVRDDMSRKIGGAKLQVSRFFKPPKTAEERTERLEEAIKLVRLHCGTSEEQFNQRMEAYWNYIDPDELWWPNQDQLRKRWFENPGWTKQDVEQWFRQKIRRNENRANAAAEPEDQPEEVNDGQPIDDPDDVNMPNDEDEDLRPEEEPEEPEDIAEEFDDADFRFLFDFDGDQDRELMELVAEVGQNAVDEINFPIQPRPEQPAAINQLQHAAPNEQVPAVNEDDEVEASDDEEQDLADERDEPADDDNDFQMDQERALPPMEVDELEIEEIQNPAIQPQQILGNADVREDGQDNEAFDPAQQPIRPDFCDGNVSVGDGARQRPDEPEDVRNFEDLHRVLHQSRPVSPEVINAVKDADQVPNDLANQNDEKLDPALQQSRPDSPDIPRVGAVRLTEFYPRSVEEFQNLLTPKRKRMPEEPLDLKDDQDDEDLSPASKRFRPGFPEAVVRVENAVVNAAGDAAEQGTGVEEEAGGKGNPAKVQVPPEPQQALSPLNVTALVVEEVRIPPNLPEMVLNKLEDMANARDVEEQRKGVEEAAGEHEERAGIRIPIEPQHVPAPMDMNVLDENGIQSRPVLPLLDQVLEKPVDVQAVQDLNSAPHQIRPASPGLVIPERIAQVQDEKMPGAEAGEHQVRPQNAPQPGQVAIPMELDERDREAAEALLLLYEKSRKSVDDGRLEDGGDMDDDEGNDDGGDGDEGMGLGHDGGMGAVPDQDEGMDPALDEDEGMGPALDEYEGMDPALDEDEDMGPAQGGDDSMGLGPADHEEMNQSRPQPTEEDEGDELVEVQNEPVPDANIPFKQLFALIEQGFQSTRAATSTTAGHSSTLHQAHPLEPHGIHEPVEDLKIHQCMYQINNQSCLAKFNSREQFGEHISSTHLKLGVCRTWKGCQGGMSL
ncbi:unnamed protein product [Caenorhabditis brenneri]